MSDRRTSSPRRKSPKIAEVADQLSQRDELSSRLKPFDEAVNLIKQISKRPGEKLSSKVGRPSGARGPNNAAVEKNGQRLKSIAIFVEEQLEKSSDPKTTEEAILNHLGGSVEPVDGPYLGHMFPLLDVSDHKQHGTEGHKERVDNAAQKLTVNVSLALNTALEEHRKPRARARRFVTDLWRSSHELIGGVGTAPIKDRHMRQLLTKDYKKAGLTRHLRDFQ